MSFKRTPSATEFALVAGMQSFNAGPLCACGCGKFTGKVQYGPRKGEHNKYVHGHYHIHIRKVVPGWGKQSQRMKFREVIREELRLETLRTTGKAFCTLDDIYETFKHHGFEKEGISRMINSNLWGREVRIPQRRKKSCEPCERKEIAYEFETELPLLTRYRFVISLDEEVEDGNSRHETITSSWLQTYTSWTPFDEVCWREEAQEREKEREQRGYELDFMRRNYPELASTGLKP